MTVDEEVRARREWVELALFAVRQVLLRGDKLLDEGTWLKSRIIWGVPIEAAEAWQGELDVAFTVM